MFQETRFQIEVLKPCKSVQELSVKSAVHLRSTASIYRDLKLSESHGSIAARWIGICRGL